MGRGNGKATLPQNLSDGSGPSNGPARAGVRSPTYSHGSTGRVHPSLLPPSLWMSLSNPSPGSRPAFAHNQQGLVQAQKRQPPPLLPPPPMSSSSSSSNNRTGNMEIASNTSSLPHSARNKPSPPLAVSPPPARVSALGVCATDGTPASLPLS